MSACKIQGSDSGTAEHATEMQQLMTLWMTFDEGAVTPQNSGKGTPCTVTWCHNSNPFREKHENI